jgi:hypothetical protein
MTYRVSGPSVRPRLMVAAVLSALWLVSCGTEDRVIIVTCAPPPSDAISVDIGSAGKGDGTVGFVNIRQFEPGTILQLNPAATEHARGSGSVLYLLRASDRDFLPPRPEAWSGSVLSGSFRVWLDTDISEALKPLKINLETTVTRNTAVVMVGGQRKILHDPLGLINADRKLVALIEDREGSHRFVAVFAASYGKELSLAYSGQSFAVNTLDVSRFYLHFKYACSSITKINSIAHLSRSQIPILFFVVGIKFDPLKRMVGIDTAPLDLATFDLAP